MVKFISDLFLDMCHSRVCQDFYTTKLQNVINRRALLIEGVGYLYLISSPFLRPFFCLLPIPLPFPSPSPSILLSYILHS